MTKIPGILVAGFVVLQEEGTNYFLSRSGYYIKRRDRKNTLGIQRAFVHTVDELLKEQGSITPSARLYYAVFNSDTGFTSVSCHPPIDIEEFINVYEAIPVS